MPGVNPPSHRALHDQPLAQVSILCSGVARTPSSRFHRDSAIIGIRYTLRHYAIGQKPYICKHDDSDTFVPISSGATNGSRPWGVE